MTQRRQIVSSAQLIAAYTELGSVHRVGARFGIRGSSVHERLVRLGVATPKNIFTDQDKDRLRSLYEDAADAGKLDGLAATFGRTKQFLCRQAHDLGLTKPRRTKA